MASEKEFYMELETLQKILEPSERKNLFSEILEELEELDKFDYISYKSFETSEGIIPAIYIAKSLEPQDVKHVKMFIGAQHNEYNGLFGILSYLRMIKNKEVNIFDILIDDQILIFLPLMNPYGFLRPTKHNKSGYFLKNGSNLNRFWRRLFVPDYNPGQFDGLRYKIPQHAFIIKNILDRYLERKEINTYILDFHETSLLYRFPRELSMDLTPFYKFDHWLKEGFIQNIIDLYDIKYYRKPLFYKCNRAADHTHINLTSKQIDTVFGKIHDYMVKNKDKLAFYFCYSNRSKDYCTRLANMVYNYLKEILWETKTPAFSHDREDHGCFVGTSNVTTRERVYCLEIESEKQFFDLFEEIEKSKTDPDYFESKLKSIDKSLKLVVECIKNSITLF